jgi:hypothetical protein
MASQVTIEEKVVEEVIPLAEREDQTLTTRFPIGRIAAIAAAGAAASAAATVAAAIVLNRRIAARRPRRTLPFATRFPLPFALPSLRFGRRRARRTPVARIAHQCQRQAQRMSKMVTHR